MSMQTTVSRARAARFEAAPYLLPALCAVAMLLCNPAEARKVITVFNATQLYSAVNTPGNAGALVLLAPGQPPEAPPPAGKRRTPRAAARHGPAGHVGRSDRNGHRRACARQAAAA